MGDDKVRKERERDGQKKKIFLKFFPLSKDFWVIINVQFKPNLGRIETKMFC